MPVSYSRSLNNVLKHSSLQSLEATSLPVQLLGFELPLDSTLFCELIRILLLPILVAIVFSKINVSDLASPNLNVLGRSSTIWQIFQVSMFSRQAVIHIVHIA